MPTQVMNDSSTSNEVKIKIAYNGEIMITYINENVTFEELYREIRGICRFSPDQVSCYFFFPLLIKPFYTYFSS